MVVVGGREEEGGGTPRPRQGDAERLRFVAHLGLRGHLSRGEEESWGRVAVYRGSKGLQREEREEQQVYEDKTDER